MLDIQLTFDQNQQPSIARTMTKALMLPRKGFSAEVGLPNIKASWLGARVDADILNDYRATLGLATAATLPILYPHVVAGVMHLSMLTHKSFPIRLLGAVHTKNSIIQHKPIACDQPLDIHSVIEGYRIVAKGLEFDFSTNIVIGGETFWEEMTTYFVAGKFDDKNNSGVDSVTAGKSFELVNLEEFEDTAQWHVPKDRGKKYAKISGDYNPIHISSLLAKLFGFKRDIAHGFGILAEAINHSSAKAAIDHAMTSGCASQESRIQIDAVFKGPVYLDSDVNLKQGLANNEQRFDVYCGHNPKPSICVEVII